MKRTEIEYRIRNGSYLAIGPRGYSCLACSMEQMRAYLDRHFGVDDYALTKID